MRVGILGGTFDPPHVGHLIAAADAVDGLGLERVVFIPAAAQPLKHGASGATAEQRLTMVQLLVGDDPRLAVDSIEIDRAGLSFTVDTLAELARRSPGDQRFLLMGADVARSFARWRDPLGVMRLAELVVLRRGETQAGEVTTWLPRDGEGHTPAYQLLDMRRVDISSTEIRARIAAGRSIHGFVPDAVREYIEQSGLYRGSADREERNA